MRYEKGHRAETAARIVGNASTRIREGGIESIKVAELMKTAGLTHGGFYLHFKSRRDLINKAFAQAMEESVDRWRRIAERSVPGKRLSSIVAFYLAQRHLADVGNGCALPALSGDVSRSGAAIRRSFAAGFTEMVSILAEDMRFCSTKEARREAIEVASGMVGALLLARAVDDAGLAEEILRIGREAVLSRASSRSCAAGKAQLDASAKAEPSGAKSASRGSKPK